MKTFIKKNIYTFAFLFLVYLLSGCANVEETLYLRNAKVTTSLIPSPIHLTDSVETPSFIFSPKFSYNLKEIFKGEVDRNVYLYTCDTIFTPSENSLSWNPKSVSTGLDLDIALSGSFAISLGASYEYQSGFNSWGGNLGIGIYNYNNGSAYRFDFGVQLHFVQYDVHTVSPVVVDYYFGGRDEYIGFYHD